MKRIFGNKWTVMLLMVVLAIILALAITITPVSGELGIDFGLFDQQGCKPSCWQGLTPGQSTSEDVNEFLVALPKTQWPKRDIRVYDTGCKSIRLVDKLENGIVDLYVVDGKLTFIQSFQFHPHKTTLGEIVDSFGNPEYFKAVLYIGFDYYEYTLEVYYPQKGLAFEILTDQEKDIGKTDADIFENLTDQEKIPGSIRADMGVSTIHYFEPGDLSSYYLSRYFCSLEKTDAIFNVQTEITNFIQEWHGFGEIDVIIDAELQNK